MTIGTSMSVPPGTTDRLRQDYRAGTAMEITGRGWREEHLVVLRDLATGEEVPVYTGLTADPDSDDGRLIDVFAVGNGPTLVLGDAAGQLRINIASTEQDRKNARWAGR